MNVMTLSAGHRALLFATIGLAMTACGDHTTAPAKPGPPARMELTSGDAQSALAGTAVAQPLSVTVRDAKGMLVPNATVTFAVTGGGGSVTPTTAITNAQGVAGDVIWTIGTKGGDQTATAAVDTVIKNFSATTRSSFTLVLRFFGPTMSPQAQTAFTNAANRIRAAIVGQINPVNLRSTDLALCGVSGLTDVLTETALGVIIYASVGPIDLAGKILAQSGPCFVRDQTSLPVIGIMKFDEADIQGYLTSGRFESVVLHEMNHVVGFGTIWEDLNLLQNPTYRYVGNDTVGTLTGSTNPRYMGAGAIAQCLTAGGTANHCASGVGIAVEQCGTEGTADSHWREVFTTTCSGSSRTPGVGTPAFDAELMTGYAEATAAMPWSAMTLAQFQDLGYTVNLLAADAYTVPSLITLSRLRAEQEAAAQEQPAEVVMFPRFTVGNNGIRAIQRRKQ